MGGSIGLEVGAIDVAYLEVGEPVDISVDLLEGLSGLELV